MSHLTKEELFYREHSHHGIYSDVGHILDKYSNQELFDFVADHLNMKTALRYYLEQQITAYVLASEK